MGFLEPPKAVRSQREELAGSQAGKEAQLFQARWDPGLISLDLSHPQLGGLTETFYHTWRYRQASQG